MQLLNVTKGSCFMDFFDPTTFETLSLPNGRALIAPKLSVTRNLKLSHNILKTTLVQYNGTLLFCDPETGPRLLRVLAVQNKI